MKRFIAWLLLVAVLTCGASGLAADDAKPAGDKKAAEPKKPADDKKLETPAPAPKACSAESQPVEVETAGDGWLVLRDACQDETEAWLSYAVNDQPARTVTGNRKETGKWAFVLTGKIPDDAIVELRFSVLQHLPSDDANKAKDALIKFRDDLEQAVKTAFDEAAVDARTAPKERQMDLLILSFNDRVRKKVSALLVKADLKRYYLKEKPATDGLLEKANFRKASDGTWEPLPAVLDDLRKASDAHARALWSATEKREHTDKAIDQDHAMASPTCLGDRKALTSEDSRSGKLKTCLEAFVAEAKKAEDQLSDEIARRKKASEDAAKKKAAAAQEVAEDEQRQKKLANDQKDLSAAIETIKKAADNVGSAIPATRSASSDSPAPTTVFDPALKRAIDRAGDLLIERENVAQEVATPSKGKAPTGNDKVAADKALKEARQQNAEGSAARNGAEYAAALLVETKERKILQDKAAAGFEIKDEDLGELHEFARRSPASEFVHVAPAKPRFFLSTGFVATALTEHPAKFKLAVPVMASICPSTYGCETKGIGSGGSAWNYVSVDLGVKLVFIGTKDPRENVPSFIMGAGFTPVYATHLSVGMNLFENPQKERVNAAFYAALTLDLVNGKDILGALGIAKPEVQVIGGKKESQSEAKEKSE